MPPLTGFKGFDPGALQYRDRSRDAGVYDMIVRETGHMKPITLAEALAEGRLDEFIAQAEAQGVGPASSERFETGLGRLVTEPPPEDQTSH